MSAFTTHPGADFVSELVSRDGMVAADARAWIERATNAPFDENAKYKLRWSELDRSERVRDRAELRVAIMSDSQLESEDRDYRKENRLSPRKTWEFDQHINARFMGARDRADEAHRNGWQPPPLGSAT